jgi:hypothetical protein
MNPEALIAQLEAVLQQPNVQEALHTALAEARISLAQADDEWHSVPVAKRVYGDSLPDAIRSSRVVVFRAGASGRYERHPNSEQFVCVVAGAVDIQTLSDGQWNANPKHADVSSRWSYVPQGVWHHPVVGGDSGCEIVALHTATADELIDEHGEPEA